MQTFKKILFLLSHHERKQAILLLILVVIMALLDLIGVASILPFMSVLSNPEIIETNKFLNFTFQLSNIYGVKTQKEFMFLSGFIVFALLITSLAFKTLTTIFQTRFIKMREYSLGRRLLEGYLNQPYIWFLSRHTADIGKTILSEVEQVTGAGINSIIELIAKGLITVSLITLLLLVDYKIAIVVGLSLGISYLLIFYFVRLYLKINGEKRVINNELRFKRVNEAFGAAKEIKIGGLEDIYITRFSKAAKIFAKTQSMSMIISQVPRYFLEAISFGGILLLLIYLISKKGGFNDALPIISLYVFAGYRLLPALQQIYASFTRLVFVKPSLDKIYDDLKNMNSFNDKIDQDILHFNNCITLENICFSYPKTSQATIKNITLTIPEKSIVGFVGATGSGKTTTIDIILGLVEPQKGVLKVDGVVINRKNVRSWQKCVGYVPQQIFLVDDTISANIAFGKKSSEISQKEVEKAAKIANLHSFVIKKLPEKYETKIGERGVKLSGGQRQRIAIARALYNKPKLLILDEATNGLDKLTEKVVMEAIKKLGKDITIILITHRLDSVKYCDIVYKVENGNIYKEENFNKTNDWI